MENRVETKDGVIHAVDGGFVISDDGGWLAGKYECIESAKLGLKFKSMDDWSYLDKLRDLINIKENRNIKLGDFK